MITSTSNMHVKFIRSLVTSRKKRYHERFFILEGVRLVRDAIDAGVPLSLVLYAPEQLVDTVAGQDMVRYAVGQSNWYEATPRVVAAAADTVTPQGIVAVAPWPDIPPSPGLWLLLDELQDPGNLGTLLRSAAAVGVGRVVCSPSTVDVYSPKVVRAAMGAHFALSLDANLSWDVIALCVNDKPVYAAVVDAERSYDEVDWLQPAVLLIGNEAHGISIAGRALATEFLMIPMVGRVESLNAAVAGSVILFEMVRQQRVMARDMCMGHCE